MCDHCRMQNTTSPQDSADALPDNPPPKGSCCQKLAGALATVPRLRLELSIFDVRISLALILDSAR